MISRADAKAQGLTQYFTGKPCKHGHVAKRWMSGGHCVVCVEGRPAVKRRRNLAQGRRRKFRRDTVRAAALLTETTGIPHEVVETVDPDTGRKNWQPRPVVPNGSSRNSVLQVTADGVQLPVPMPSVAA